MHKGLRILFEISQAEPDGLRLVDVHKRTGFQQATILRLSYTLTQWRLVRRDEDLRFHLGTGAVDLGGTFLHNSDLREVAFPHMRALRNDLGETVCLAVLDGTEVLYLERLDSNHPVRTNTRIGARHAAYATSLGKAILAFSGPSIIRSVVATSLPTRGKRSNADRDRLLRELDVARHQAFAVDDGENEDNVCSVSAVVVDHAGRTAGALSVSAPGYRFSVQQATVLGPRVREVADRISRDLGGDPALMRTSPHQGGDPRAQ